MKKILLTLLLLLTAVVASAQVTITNLGVTGQTNTSATISWTTSGAATTQVLFGINGQLTSNTVQNPALVTSHTAVITGIFNNTIFSYAAVSVDNVGHITQSPTQIFQLCSNNGGGTPGYTQVAGTVNNYYEYGGYSITWVNQSGQSVSPTVCGVPIATSFTGTLSPQGTLSVSLPDNLQVVPSPSQWSIVINSAGGIGSYTNASQTITGPSVNLSSLLGPNATGFTSHCFVDQSTGTVFPTGCGGGGGGGGGIGGSGTLNSIAKFTPNGTTIGNSEGIADGVSPVQWPLGVNLVSNALYVVIPNNGSTGTTANLLAAQDSAGNAINAQPGDTNNLIGVTGFGAGTTGSATVAYSGRFPCRFDNQSAPKDWVILGSSSQCHDAGAVEPTGVQNIGKVVTVNAGAGTLATISMGLPDVVNNTGGSGILNSCAGTGALAYYAAPGQTISCDLLATTDGAGNLGGQSLTLTGPSAGFIGFGQSSLPAISQANTAYFYADTSIGTTFGTAVPSAPGTAAQVLTITSVVDATHIKTGWAAAGGGSGGGANKTSFDECSPGQSANPGNSFWFVTPFTNWDGGTWQFLAGAAGDVWCLIRVPSNVTASPMQIVLDLSAADNTAGHTATFNTADACSSSRNLQVGSLTAASTQLYTSTTTAYANNELSFNVQSSCAVDQYLVVQIHQAASGTNTNNILMPTPKLKVQ